MRFALTLFTLLFFTAPTYAKECNLNALGLGEEFQVLKEKYNLNTDTYNKSFFYNNIKGKAICKDLTGAEIKLTFVEKKLAEILLEKRSSSQELLLLASKNFGELKTKPNMDNKEVKSFASFWDDKEKVVTYSFAYIADEKLYREKIILVDRGSAEKLNEFNSMNESTDKEAKKK